MKTRKNRDLEAILFMYVFNLKEEKKARIFKRRMCNQNSIFI